MPAPGDNQLLDEATFCAVLVKVGVVLVMLRSRPVYLREVFAS
jgi:hypothetical protein